jgi:hypothetical protein
MSSEIEWYEVARYVMLSIGADAIYMTGQR